MIENTVMLQRAYAWITMHYPNQDVLTLLPEVIASYMAAFAQEQLQAQINHIRERPKQSVLDSIPEGYSQIMQIAKNGLKLDSVRARGYMLKFIELHPDNRLSIGFKNIIEGKESTVTLDRSGEPDKTIDQVPDGKKVMSAGKWLEKYAMIDNDNPVGGTIYALTSYANYISEIKEKEAYEAGWKACESHFDPQSEIGGAPLQLRADFNQWKEQQNGV